MVALAGCGISDPYTTGNRTPESTTTRTTVPAVTRITTVTNADPAPERGGTIPSSATKAQDTLPGNAGRSTPQQALALYARLYINWSASTVAERQRRLASISLDSARAQALQAAASYQHDSTLQASHVANSGSIISIAPGQGPARDGWVIVTTEKTSGQGDYTGLPATVHVTYARLTHRPDGWIVTDWSPRS
jgi:hypothetical protein